jgi:hypothetical protein
MTTFRSAWLSIAICFFMTVAGPAANCSAADKPFAHPGVLRNRAELDFVKAKVAEKKRPERWQSSHASWGTLMHAGQPAF